MIVVINDENRLIHYITIRLASSFPTVRKLRNKRQIQNKLEMSVPLEQ